MHSAGSSPPHPNQPHNHRQWSALLREVRGHTEHMAAEFVHDLRQRGLYGRGEVSDAHLHATALKTFNLLIGHLAGDVGEREIIQAATELGCARARMGIGRTALVSAVQLDFPVLWRHLRQAATGPAHMELLADNVENLHAVVDTYALEVSNAYAMEKSRVMQDASIVSRRYVEELLRATTLSPQALAKITAGLRLEGVGQFHVFVSSSASAQRTREILAAELMNGQVFGIGLMDSFAFFTADLKLYSPAILRRRDKGTSGLMYSTDRGLLGVRQAVHAGLHALQFHCVGDGWNTAAGARDDMVARMVHRTAPEEIARGREKLAKIHPAELEKITATVHAYCGCGSIKSTAEEVYCHRNTVINRMRTFADITGVDPTIPRNWGSVMALLHRPDGGGLASS